MARSFQRTIESFACQVCGHLVQGNGYTNHCPECLWSLHVDKNPGDREETCQGLMQPVALTISHSVKSIIHRCQKCAVERKNKVAPNDNSEVLLRLPLEAPHARRKKK